MPAAALRCSGAAHLAREADRHLYSRHYLRGVIGKALGADAAELMLPGANCATSGAGSDLIQATGRSTPDGGCVWCE